MKIPQPDLAEGFLIAILNYLLFLRLGRRFESRCIINPPPRKAAGTAIYEPSAAAKERLLSLKNAEPKRSIRIAASAGIKE